MLLPACLKQLFFSRGFIVIYKGIVVATLAVLVSGFFCGAGAVLLPETGQTKCYSGASPWKEIACTGTGQDGEFRKGLPWPSPRFTIIHCNASGPCADQASDCDGSAATDIIRDNLTGLVWPTQATSGRTWHQALTDAAAFQSCGLSDWRLPNINELLSLLNSGAERKDTWLHDQGFSGVGFGDYHSSTTYAANPLSSWTVNIGYGYTGPATRTTPGWVLPVRGPDAPGPAPVWQTGQTTCYNDLGSSVTCTGTGQDGEYRQGAAWPSPRFTVGTGDKANCITDNLTHLMWVKTPADTQAAWLAGLSYANALNLCGYSDWRMPNIVEQRSLINFEEDSTAAWLDTQGFAAVPSGRFWTSTTFLFDPPTEITDATLTDTHDGTVTFVTGTKDTGTHYAWAVRTTAGTVQAVTKGTGSGTITSLPKGISCGADCSESYAFGTVITFTAAAKAGSTFTGWSGGWCTGTGKCTVALDENITVTATFNATPTLTISPRSLNFGALKKDGTSTPRLVTIKNTGTPGSVLTFTDTPDITGTNASEFTADTSACTGPLAKNESCTVSVTYKPASWLSPKSAALNVYTDAPKNGNVTIKLAGTSGPPKIAAAPATLSFGTVSTTADPLIKSIAISNSGISDLVFASPAVTETSFSVLPYVCPSVAKGKNCKISIQFDPASQGVKDCDLTMTSNDPAKSPTKVRLKGTGK